MNDDASRKLADLKARLADLKRRDPSHCSGKTYVGHGMPPSLFQEIEDLEEEIKALEAKTGDGLK